MYLHKNSPQLQTSHNGRQSFAFATHGGDDLRGELLRRGLVEQLDVAQPLEQVAAAHQLGDKHQLIGCLEGVV